MTQQAVLEPAGSGRRAMIRNPYASFVLIYPHSGLFF